MEKKVINFYKKADPYGQFSNFFHSAFELKGKKWLTTEHYFQAMKFEGTAKEETIRALASPFDAFKLGNVKSAEFPLRPDWPEIKDDVMLTALRAKFSSNKKLQDLLLSTEDAQLVENTEKDSYWGNGGDGTGKNMLGKLLEKVREELKESALKEKK